MGLRPDLDVYIVRLLPCFVFIFCFQFVLVFGFVFRSQISHDSSESRFEGVMS